ncbi:hypothetical protein, partial [Pseudothauera rhizosphaerae]|uniref:hypothetical protein n=1 Tax=Pseudothauera rhizosphaerae TaxID=2565932 RepID=UPI001B3B2C9F
MSDYENTSIGALVNAWSGLSSAYLAGLSGAYANLAERSSSLYLDEASRYQAVVDAHRQAIEEAASWAKAFRDNAIANGEKGIAKVSEKWADYFDERASTLSDPVRQAETKLSDLTRHISESNDALGRAVPKLGDLGRFAGPIADGYGMYKGWQDYAETGDTTALSKSASGVLVAELGALIGGAIGVAVFGASASMLLPVVVAAGVGAAVGSWLGNEYGDEFRDFVSDAIGDKLDPLFEMIDRIVNTFFGNARAWQPVRVDPLVLDLDGDGIETRGIDGTILFDHDGDGIRTGTGWVKADDALLVLDRN